MAVGLSQVRERNVQMANKSEDVRLFFQASLCYESEEQAEATFGSKGIIHSSKTFKI